MKFLLTVVTLAVLAMPAFAGAPKKHEFNAPADEVFTAAIQAIQKNWVVSFADRKAGMISFTTGTSAATWGMDCSAGIKEIGPSKTEVSVRAQKKHQMIAWGAGDRIADRLFKGIDEELKNEHVKAQQ